MKKKLLKVIRQFSEDGHDLKEEPVLFTWRYDEFPDIQLKLLIQEVDEDTPNEQDTIH